MELKVFDLPFKNLEEQVGLWLRDNWKDKHKVLKHIKFHIDLSNRNCILLIFYNEVKI